MGAPDLAAETERRLRAALVPLVDPAYAAGAAAYLRDQFPFLGVRTPDRRRAMRVALRDLAPSSEAELTAVARVLWAAPERELQQSACDLVRTHIRVAGPGFIEVVGELVTTKSWWDTVDVLAAHAAGPLARRFPAEVVPVLDRWIDADDHWLARTAILHQLTWKGDTDADHLFAYCRRRASDREFFIRKAIGWALRQHAAVDPEAVAAFLDATPELSGLSVREARRGVERARR
jgi:3-methyladenine DNA glycosylase AlkD